MDFDGSSFNYIYNVCVHACIYIYIYTVYIEIHWYQSWSVPLPSLLFSFEGGGGEFAKGWPVMDGSAMTGNGNHTTYKHGDDNWGLFMIALCHKKVNPLDCQGLNHAEFHPDLFMWRMRATKCVRVQLTWNPVAALFWGGGSTRHFNLVSSFCLGSRNTLKNFC